jgi:2'-5' RNA ligase
LKEAGFIGKQTPGLPYHISLAAFPLEKEQEAIDITRKAGAEFSPVPVHISHMGLFAGGRVLFCAPERNPRLDALHAACEKYPQKYPWTPHVTVLIDEPDAVCAALPVLVKSFSPFVGTVSRLHLCAFWPAREIASAELNGEQ